MTPDATSPDPSRRAAIKTIAALAGGVTVASGASRGDGDKPRLATFSADVTIPTGHPCMGGGISPAKRVGDPLLARGVVLSGPGLPVVIVAVDWCEIRNAAHDRWREALAEAAGTEPGRVLVSSVHQHDAPVADLEAERILRSHNVAGRVCDPEFHERAVLRVAGALKQALREARPVTHVGTGMARVEQVASNRRYLMPDGTPAFGRTSACRDPFAREQPEGTIDPMLRTLSFWDEDRPLAALSVYAVHPMSRYGQGVVSADFVGDARKRRQDDDASVFQMYLSGCSGNVTAGKYNDGEPDKRAALAGRLHAAMVAAWKVTKRYPLERIGFRSVPIKLVPRNDAGFTQTDLERRLATDPKPFGQCLAAMGLSWRARWESGRTVDLPVLDLGAALVLLMPGESYVEYQLLAQAERPDAFVVTFGYGECGTGYVPTEKAIAEDDSNLRDWCWVAPGAEGVIRDAFHKLLPKPR